MSAELEKAALRVIKAWDDFSLRDEDVQAVDAAIDALRVALRLIETPKEPQTHCPIHFWSHWIGGQCNACVVIDEW